MPNVNADYPRPPLQYLVIIEPLGLLYGSAGRFLSPENLVGRSGTHFPPSSTTLSGMFAATLSDESQLLDLQLAGPFWAWSRSPQNFYVPTPFHCLVQDERIRYQLGWEPSPVERWQAYAQTPGAKPQTPPNEKFSKGTWLPIRHWKRLNQGGSLPVEWGPWEFCPHLHPHLKADERVSDRDSNSSLFLENAVQLNPQACLVYLANVEIPAGCYRFGGEGHLVNARSEPLCPSVRALLDLPLQNHFATITPGVWGSKERSYRAPCQQNRQLYWDEIPVSALLAQRPHPHRYRLGHSRAPGDNPSRLSRGRYAVPAGTVYQLRDSLNLSWEQWPDRWFPTEGRKGDRRLSFKRWGCALALPLDNKSLDCVD